MSSSLSHLEHAVSIFYLYYNKISIYKTTYWQGVSTTISEIAGSTREGMLSHFKSIKDVLELGKLIYSATPHNDLKDIYKPIHKLYTLDLEERITKLEQELQKRDEVLVNMVLINTELKRHISQ